MSKQTEAQRLADVLGLLSPYPDEIRYAAAELLRQEALIAELAGALKGLDDAYCRAGASLTREERTEDRKRLIAARAALAKVQQ